MKNKLYKRLLVMLVSLVIINVKAQSYMEGFVVTNEGDTVVGTLKNIDYRYSKTVVVKDAGAPLRTFPTKNLTSIGVGNVVYEKITYDVLNYKKGEVIVDMKTSFSKVEIKGSMTLYSLLAGDAGTRTYYSSSGYGYYNYSAYRDYIVSFVLKNEAGKLVAIDPQYFNENYQLIFGNCSYLPDKIKNEKYTVYALKELVEEYNRCSK